MLRKKDLPILAVIGAMLCLIALISALPAQAIGSATLSNTFITATPGGPCDASVTFVFTLNVVTNNTDDGGSEDFYTIDVIDGNGNIIAQKDSFISPYNAAPFSDYIAGNMGSVTAPPLTLRFWDTDSSWNKPGAPLMVQVVDPATINPACGSLSNSSGGGSLCAADGRINADDCAGPVALYCDGDELQVYNVDPETGQGWLAFTFDGWPDDAPGVNTLLASQGSTKLWHLESGEFQLNADQGEGKTYAFVFNGCPYDGGGYHANLDPQE